MADRYWSISAGGDKVSVAETGSSTSGAHVEVRITYDNTALAKNKALALALLEHVSNRISEDTWPPA